jgi:hypothetical protein
VRKSIILLERRSSLAQLSGNDIINRPADQQFRMSNFAHSSPRPYTALIILLVLILMGHI